MSCHNFIEGTEKGNGDMSYELILKDDKNSRLTVFNRVTIYVLIIYLLKLTDVFAVAN